VVIAVPTVLTVVGDDSRRDVARARTRQPVVRPGRIDQQCVRQPALLLDAADGCPGVRRAPLPGSTRVGTLRGRRGPLHRPRFRACRTPWLVAGVRIELQVAPCASPCAILLSAGVAPVAPSTWPVAARIGPQRAVALDHRLLACTRPRRRRSSCIDQQVALPPLDLLVNANRPDSHAGQRIVERQRRSWPSGASSLPRIRIGISAALRIHQQFETSPGDLLLDSNLHLGTRAIICI
jgi:hypothetical protein